MLKSRRAGLAAGTLLLVVVACVAAILLTQRHGASGHPLIPDATATASVAATKPVSGIQVVDCTGDPPAQSPTSVNLTCGDGSVTYVNVVWQSWTGDQAVGVGTLRENACEPNCATGKPASESATITLSNPQNLNGTMLFTAMTVVPDAPNPHKFQPISAAIPQ